MSIPTKNWHRPISWHLLGTLLRQALSSWADDKASRLGAAVAFYSLLSLAPLLLLMLTAAKAIWGREAAQGQIVNQMNGLLGEQGAQVVQNILSTSHAHHSGLIASLAGVGMLVFGASGIFGELQDAMNIIWKVPPHKGRAISVLVKEYVFSFVMVLGCGLLLIASLMLSTYMAMLSHYVMHILPSTLITVRVVNMSVGFVVTVMIFALIFKIVPDVTLAWRDVMPGAILTALLFLIGKFLIGFYLGHIAVTSSYGAAGSLVFLLLWIYYSSQILFLGAEITHTYITYFSKSKH